MKLDLYFFFISLFVGLFIVYVTAPKPKIILECLKNDKLKSIKNI